MVDILSTISYWYLHDNSPKDWRSLINTWVHLSQEDGEKGKKEIPVLQLHISVYSF